MTDLALPSPYYQFFAYVEPTLALAGGVYAWVLPQKYHDELLPPAALAKLSGKLVRSDAAVMAVRQLGNCYFLLGLMSLLLIPSIASSGLSTSQAVKIFRTFFLVLAIADITHILCTLVDLGDQAWHPASWNTLAHGNTTLVVGLFLWRMAYFRYSAKLVDPGQDRKTR